MSAQGNFADVTGLANRNDMIVDRPVTSSATRLIGFLINGCVGCDLTRLIVVIFNRCRPTDPDVADRWFRVRGGSENNTTILSLSA